MTVCSQRSTFSDVHEFIVLGTTFRLSDGSSARPQNVQPRGTNRLKRLPPRASCDSQDAQQNDAKPFPYTVVYRFPE